MFAALAPALVSGCSASIDGTGRANPSDLAAHQAEVRQQHIHDVTVKACQDFRDGRIQVIRALNDFVDAYNTEHGYDGATAGPKLTTALETIDKWTGTVGRSLVPEVKPEIKTALEAWRKAAGEVSDSLKRRDEADALNPKGDALNQAADAAQEACAPY
ncbi:MAG: hypothetical protein LLG14_22445 [Nocardiaceae bacterium]|nr:hypothetical protein [Nocardiaceae bacterium]